MKTPKTKPTPYQLAAARTHMANERTWLAYIRTGLTLIIAGITVAQVFGFVFTGLAFGGAGGMMLAGSTLQMLFRRRRY